MSSLRNVDGKTIIKFVESIGYNLIRSKGNHKIFSHKRKKNITIPVYKKKIVKVGLLNGLLKDMTVEKSLLVNYLNR